MSELQYGERVAIARLRALLELLPTALDRQLAETGLTAFEFTLLEALREAEEGRLRLTALASRTNATLPRLSRVVTGLERKGLVTRAACEADGRATNAILTSAGARAHAEVAPLYEESVRRMILDGLGAEGVKMLADVSLAILGKLDPTRRLAITGSGESEADPVQGAKSPDPDDACAADPLASSG